MQREKIFALTERIKQVCPPECKVEIAPTKQQNNIYLIIIQFPSTDIALPVQPVTQIDSRIDRFQATFKRDPNLQKAYQWETQSIHNFHYEIIMPLLEDAEHFRVVYCSGGKFVLYTQVFGCMKDYANQFNYIGMNDRQYFKYIGNCRNIDILISFLMTTYHAF